MHWVSANCTILLNLNNVLLLHSSNLQKSKSPPTSTIDDCHCSLSVQCQNKSAANKMYPPINVTVN